MKTRSVFLSFALALLAAQIGRADFIRTATLLGSNETPPNASTAFGRELVTYSTALNQLGVTVTFSGLSASATASHIHFGVPGVAGPVVLPFIGFPATTSGTFSTVLTPASAFNPSPGNGINTFADMVNAIQAGNAYANIHDATFPGGEIRGQLSPVPEPSGVVLAGTGLAGLLGFAWSRRRLRAEH